MAYKVVYGPMPKIRKKSGILRFQALTAMCLMLFSLGVRQVWPEGREVLQDFLMPGDMTVTQAAFGDMLENLENGQNLTDAVTAFCRQIVQDELQKGS